MNVAQAITDTVIEVSTDDRLLKIDLTVLTILCRHINNDTLDCYPFIQTIATLAKKSDRTIKRSLKRLYMLGYITKIHRYGHYGQRSNLYTVHGMSQRLKKEDNVLKNNDNVSAPNDVTPPVTPSVTPYITTNINNNNIISNVPKKEKELEKQEKPLETQEKIEEKTPRHTIKLADDAKVDRIPLGNPLCPMTSDYHIPINWITWAMVTYDVDVDKAKQVSLDYVRHYVERKDYSTGGQFQSMGWERLYRTYWADYIESKLKAVKAEQDKTCDCGKHHAGREHATPRARARAVKYNLIMGLGYVNELAIAYLADYERHHGLVWDDALESAYRIKTTRMPSYETLSRIAKLSLPTHLVPTDIKMAS